MPRPRGARPSPRHRLAAASPHRIIGATPAQWLFKPAQLSMWLNATFGCCVTSEEAFGKACDNPEIFIEDHKVKEWARRYGVLNGTDLVTVLDLMQNSGFSVDGKLYNDGPFSSVDWTNAEVLKNAITQGPVKIGVAADQLEDAVPEAIINGWLATGFKRDTNEDHCTSLCGFGTVAWLKAQLGGGDFSADVDSLPAYAMFTWGSIGIIDVPSLLAITGEAWLRLPTTVIKAA
jgi:hypothetical protein